jgi:hypothetical protein
MFPAWLLAWQFQFLEGPLSSGFSCFYVMGFLQGFVRLGGIAWPTEKASLN